MVRLFAGTLALAGVAMIGISAQTRAKDPATEELYRTQCQVCHGPKGVSPAPSMSFVGRKWKQGSSLAEIRKSISDGVPGTPMLPFKDKLTAAQIAALAEHVRAFDKTLKGR